MLASWWIALRADAGALAVTVQELAQEAGSVGVGGVEDGGGRAHGDDGAAGGAAFGAEVDDPVGFLDDVEVVLDGDDGVATVDQAVEHADEAFDVGEVQAGGRLVEHVERRAARLLAELVGELDALRLAAGERVAALAEREIAEADVGEQ